MELSKKAKAALAEIVRAKNLKIEPEVSLEDISGLLFEISIEHPKPLISELSYLIHHHLEDLIKEENENQTE